jgi:hypothetical protein
MLCRGFPQEFLPYDSLYFLPDVQSTLSIVTHEKLPAVSQILSLLKENKLVKLHISAVLVKQTTKELQYHTTNS